MNNKFLIGVIAIFLAVLGFASLKSDKPQTTNPVVQEFRGQTESFSKEFQQGMFVGGRVASSTTSTTGTLLASAIENATVIDYTLNVADVTLTLPATSTIGFMRNPGDTKTFFVRNATTTATMDITFANGTGMNYKRATSTKTLIGDTDGGNTARITLIRQADSDIDMLVDLFVD